MSEINLFTARNLVHSMIKKHPGFRGININAKTGVRGTLCIYVVDAEAKENIYKICGDKLHGYYIEYIIVEKYITMDGLKFN